MSFTVKTASGVEDRIALELDDHAMTELLAIFKEYRGKELLSDLSAEATRVGEIYAALMEAFQPGETHLIDVTDDTGAQTLLNAVSHYSGAAGDEFYRQRHIEELSSILLRQTGASTQNIPLPSDDPEQMPAVYREVETTVDGMPVSDISVGVSVRETDSDPLTEEDSFTGNASSVNILREE